MPQDDRIAGLARQIDTTVKREHLVKSADHIAALRRRGACELHSLCATFVASVNSRLSGAELSLSPPLYDPEVFHSPGVNLIQIGAGDRLLHLAFQATRDLVSTEKCLIPYVLEGEVRAFNQEMLEHFEVRSQLLFFCVEENKASWRYSDWRTGHAGLFTGDLLLSLMEKLFA